MRTFSLLVKPAGSACDLSCPYCFYRGHGSGVRMDEALLERVLTSYRELPLVRHEVAFQGGEPLLMGEAFYQRAAALGEGISFSVQTNATQVTASWADFFAAADWLVGVSPHVAASVAGLRLLQAAGVRTNVLQLVTREHVGAPEALYRHLRDELGACHHQYIECTAPEDYAVTGAQWGEFLCRLLDVWIGDGDVGRVSVRLFDSLAAQLAGGEPTMCNFARDCRHHLVVEANGDVYPCDFHVSEAYRLGNIREQSWDELINSPVYRDFGLKKRLYPDCPRNQGRLDAGWQRFFAYALPIFRARVVPLISDPEKGIIRN